MRVVCAWCERVIRDDVAEGSRDSHGICDECLAKVRRRDSLPLGSFLEQFSVPILAIDDAYRIIGINDAGRRALGSFDEASFGRLCGDIVECDNAALQGGCTRTDPCLACGVREAVAALGAGRSQTVTRQVYHDVTTGDGKTRLTILLHASFAGEVLLVRLEGVTALPVSEGVR